jgi:hypothetical protein
MVRLTRGKPRAAAKVYDRFGTRAYSLARRILADDHLAQDVIRRCSSWCGGTRPSLTATAAR